MMTIQDLEARRRVHWGQTPETKTPDPAAASLLIERVGVATLYPVSPEFPNLLYAYTGDPTTQVTSDWDSVSGQVYTWRWTLGRQETAFYTAIIRGRPTWVSWALLPAILQLRGELRMPDELYQAGKLSSDAYRIVQALEECEGTMSTGELRKAAGFPTGKPQRAAYLKAIAELEDYLFLAKVFATDGDEMSHSLVSVRYPQHVEAANRLTRVEALDQFLRVYLPYACYIVPETLAKHLGLPFEELCSGVERLLEADLVVPGPAIERKGSSYIWSGVASL